MRTCRIFIALVMFKISSMNAGFAQNGAKVHEIDGFMVRGAFADLDPQMMRHRLTLEEIEKATLNGESTSIDDILAWMAKCEKLHPRVEEPLEVRGSMSVSVPPNTMGDEAFTTCFYAFNFNGLGLSGIADDLVLVLPEKHPKLQRLGEPWNRDHILSTQLFRLGYLRPDPVMQHYRDAVGTSRGHAVIEHRSNVLIVTDTPKALESLRAHIDSEILEAMGSPASEEHPADQGPRPPSLGAIASRETIHFYLMAFARRNRFPLTAREEKNVVARHYPEADLWTNEQAYKALATEYKRIGEFVRLARETGGQGWDETNPERTLSPGQQKRLEIRFGLATPLPGAGAASKTKKAARKR